MKHLIDTKKDKDRDTNDKKLNKMDINSEIKRMSGLKSDLTKIISKYEIIKQTYENDVKNITKYKNKKEYFEYTEPKSRISFYAATLNDFAKPYDKREGVNLIFPVYASEPFFIETEYIGDAMVKKIKDGIKSRNGIFFHKYTNLDSNIVDMINDYNTKSGELVVEDKKLDAALDAAKNKKTSDTAQGVGSEQSVKDQYEDNVLGAGLVNQDTTEAMAAAKDEKANREAVDEALDTGRETAPPITGGQRGGDETKDPEVDRPPKFSSPENVSDIFINLALNEEPLDDDSKSKIRDLVMGGEVEYKKYREELNTLVKSFDQYVRETTRYLGEKTMIKLHLL